MRLSLYRKYVPGTDPLGPPSHTPTPGEETTPDLPPPAGTDASERLAASCFLLSTAAAIAFFAFYWVNPGVTDNVQNVVYGCLLAVVLGGVGAGAVLWAKRLMPAEEAVQERHPFGSPPADSAAAAETWQAGADGSGIARRPLLRRTLLLASGTLILPVLAPLRSLGSAPKHQLQHTDWTKGARLVDQFNNPIKLGDIEVNGINASVFPENHTDVDSAATSTIMLIRLPPELVEPKQQPKSFQGHVAYSKICTHAGCPVGLYSQQSHRLVCPCHQSQFKVLEGCKPVFGPATRSLPQLAISVDAAGYFIALGDFDEPVGPAYWSR